MRGFTYLSLTLVAVVMTLRVEAAPVEDCVLPAARHPWASFQVGSSKTVRVTTETLDANGQITEASVNQTTTTLTDSTATDYDLQSKVEVEIAGKQFASQPTSVRQGFFGEQAGETVRTSLLAGSTLEVAGQVIPVQVAHVSITGRDSRREIMLYYCTTCMPYVVRRETKLFDAQHLLIQESLTTTVGRELSIDLLGKRHFAWKTHTERTSAQGRVVIDETHCADVPGGVVEHTTQEFDAKDQLVRRSRLELVSYHAATHESYWRKRRVQRRGR